MFTFLRHSESYVYSFLTSTATAFTTEITENGNGAKNVTATA